MHSSRMHTARSSTVHATEATRCQHLKVLWSWGYGPGGKYGPKEGTYSPTPTVGGMTHACENFTFPQLRWQAVKIRQELPITFRHRNRGLSRTV